MHDLGWEGGCSGCPVVRFSRAPVALAGARDKLYVRRLALDFIKEVIDGRIEGYDSRDSC